MKKALCGKFNSECVDNNQICDKKNKLILFFIEVSNCIFTEILKSMYELLICKYKIV